VQGVRAHHVTSPFPIIVQYRKEKRRPTLTYDRGFTVYVYPSSSGLPILVNTFRPSLLPGVEPASSIYQWRSRH